MSSVIQSPSLGNGKQPFRIRPSNAPSDGVFAHQGNPVLTFEMPNSNVLLDPSTLRLVGKLRVKSGTFNPEEPLVDGVKPKVSIDPLLGVSTCFENVSWSSKMSRNVIEKVNNYPKLVNSIRPALSSTQNFQSDLSNEGLATGNVDFFLEGTATSMIAGFGADFSTQLYTGLTMASGNRLPLMKLGGLMLSIDLAPDSAVFYRTGEQSPQYELFDLSLVGEYYIPSAEERGALAGMTEGTLEMNTFNSLFSILQSSTHNSVFNLGIKELISCYFSFVPASYINNYSFNQYQSMRITQNTSSNQIVKLNFLRNGTQMPFLFDLDVLDESNEAQLSRYYLMSLKKLNELTKTAIDANDNDIRLAIGSPEFLQTTANQLNQLNRENYVLGVPYDMLGNFSGADFSNQPLTIDIRSTLNDATPNALYLYTLAKTMVAYSPSGIRVMS